MHYQGDELVAGKYLSENCGPGKLHAMECEGFCSATMVVSLGMIWLESGRDIEFLNTTLIG